MAIKSRLSRLETVLGRQKDPCGRSVFGDLKELLDSAKAVRAWLLEHAYADVASALAAGETPPVEGNVLELILRAEAQRRCVTGAVGAGATI